MQLGVNLSGSQALENTGCQSAAQQESQLERPWTTEAPTLIMTQTPPTVPELAVKENASFAEVWLSGGCSTTLLLLQAYLVKVEVLFRIQTRGNVK